MRGLRGLRVLANISTASKVFGSLPLVAFRMPPSGVGARIFDGRVGGIKFFVPMYFFAHCGRILAAIDVLFRKHRSDNRVGIGINSQMKLIPFLNQPCTLSASLVVPVYCLHFAFAFTNDLEKELRQDRRVRAPYFSFSHSQRHSLSGQCYRSEYVRRPSGNRPREINGNVIARR